LLGDLDDGGARSVLLVALGRRHDLDVDRLLGSELGDGARPHDDGQLTFSKGAPVTADA